MRPVVILAAIIVAFLLGGLAEHLLAVPFGTLELAVRGMRPVALPVADDANTAVPRYSNVRGLEDAPRADVPQGAKTDFQRCVATMMLRREPEGEARTVCQKIIAGISG